MEPYHQYKRVVPFILFALALVLLFLLVRTMIVILLSSVLLAYIAFPIYSRIQKNKLNKSFSIILALIVIVFLVLLPLFFLLSQITQQGYYFYNSFSDNLAKGAVFGFRCESAESKICYFFNQLEKFSLDRFSALDFHKHLQDFLPIWNQKITNFILSIPLIVAQFFLTLVITYFILKEWKKILKTITDLLPMRKKTIKKLISEFEKITHTVIYAQLFVAFVQGIVGAIGFYLLGVPFPIFFGIAMAFFALIPVVGTAIVWVPASLFLILNGYASYDYWILSKGIVLLLYGLFIISTIDNLLLATIVHAKAKVNQIIVIVGVIGGVSVFGIMGIFIGPILLPLLITYFETFKERFK